MSQHSAEWQVNNRRIGIYLSMVKLETIFSTHAWQNFNVKCTKNIVSSIVSYQQLFVFRSANYQGYSQNCLDIYS